MTNSLEENTTVEGVVSTVSSEEKAFISGFEQLILAKEQGVIKVFEEMLQFCKPNEVMMAFNGGKDCTVVLDMLEKFYRQLPLCLTTLTVLYIQCPNSFPEVDAFVEDCQTRYQINIIRRTSSSIKDTLQEVCAEMPHIKAVVLGSRRTDPYCEKAELFQATDPGWPPLMRVNPILDWTQRDVWNYIFYNNVPYCSLYQLGYTSLGSTTNTTKNPFLKVVDPYGGVTYRHAYQLRDDNLERAGRF